MKKYTGLTDIEVNNRIEAGQINSPVESLQVTVKEIVLENIFTYFNLIFCVLAVLLCVVGSFRNLTFLPVVLANIAIGIFQEIRAKNALDKLNMIHTPFAEVIRNGKKQRVNIHDLVVDDLVIFKNGNQICADAVVVDGEIRVNESLLTGEADEISKKVSDHLLSGSYVVSGSCIAKLEKVGEDSYISRLTLAAKEMKREEKSEMIRSLDSLLKIVGIGIIPVAGLLFWQAYYLNGNTFQESIVAMVAAVIGMIPEGLYLLASVAMAVSTIRLANDKVLLHDMKSIETLARVDVLCVDKTGTITEENMKVNEIAFEESICENEQEFYLQRLQDIVHAMDDENGTMSALKQYFVKEKLEEPEEIVPFSSSTKYSISIFEDSTYVLGAPEFVLKENYSDYRDKVESYVEDGLRVLVLGKCEKGKNIQDVTPLIYLMLSNPVRESAPATFAYFEKQGVEIKVISGDNPATVQKTAEKAGIRNAHKVIDGESLAKLSNIDEAVQEYTIFSRVIPEQKQEIIDSLKRNGRTVAMTGDGVNDILALKKADCSIALASGSEAAVQVAQVVLLDSDFAKMPHVVFEGRRVVNNIQRSASLFLVKNIFSILVALLSIGFAVTYPLQPSQVSMIGIFTIGTPAFFLALQPNKERIKGHFLKNIFINALPAGLTDAFVVCMMVTFGNRMGCSVEEIATAATYLVAFIGCVGLYRVCQPFDRIRSLIWCICVTGFVLTAVFLPFLFMLGTLSAKTWRIAGVIAIAGFVVFQLLANIMHKRIHNK